MPPKRQTTSGVQRSTEVMPILPSSGGRLVKQGSRDSNDGSVSSEGSKWVEKSEKISKEITKLYSKNYKIY